MTKSNGEQEARRLEQAVNTFIERIQQVPADRLDQNPAPGEWSVKQLAAHSAEIYPFWANQIRWLRTNTGKPFGRTAADPDRIRFVEEHKSDSLDSLIQAIRTGSADAAAALRSYNDQEWQTITGVHAARGEMDMDFIAQLFLAGHAEEHLHQLDETLAQLGNARN
jgi:uncharacterized damage-inducible protein DinB